MKRGCGGGGCCCWHRCKWGLYLSPRTGFTGSQVIWFEHRCGTEVSGLVWSYLMSSIGCFRNMFLHRAHFLFSSFSPCVTEDRP